MLPIRLIIVAILLFFGFRTFAKDVYIFDAKRQLSLNPGEIKPKDFYINAGTESGLKPNVIVTVSRRQSLYDPYQNKAAGDILVPVAEIRILYSQDGLSVARLEKMFDRGFLPALEFDGIMVGDRLDLSSAKSRKSAAVQPQAPVYGPQPAAETITESAEFSSVAPEIRQSDVTINSQTM